MINGWRPIRATANSIPRLCGFFPNRFVEMGSLPSEPDMSTLYTEEFLPKAK